MNEQARAAVLGWQQTVNAAWEQQSGQLANPAEPPPWESYFNRKLTPAEISIARQVFGNALDTSRVELHEGGLLGSFGYVRATPDRITFPPGKLTDPGPGFNRLLVHELTHIWQYQHGWTVPDTLDDSLDSDYNYGGEQGLREAVAAGKPFDDFDLEDQAEIVADYYTKMNGDASAYLPYIRSIRNGTSHLPPVP
jgi:hypothetical protein